MPSHFLVSRYLWPCCATKVQFQGGLRKIALELTQMIRNSVTIDWMQRESVQAEIRLKVKKILRKYGYPPDKETKATETVLEQVTVCFTGTPLMFPVKDTLVSVTILYLF
jgi:hypothetical protein